MLLGTGVLADGPGTQPAGPLVVSAASGAWSSSQTWQGGQVPTDGDRVLVRGGDRVTYDLVSDAKLWSVHVAGRLDFAADRDTQMNVGLLLVKPGDDGAETDDFVGTSRGDHAHHHHATDAAPAELHIGTADMPIAAGHRAVVRLTWQSGMDTKIYPALICYGGTIDLHGAPLERSWVKLRDNAKAGDATLTLAMPVGGWRAGDRVLIPTTTRPPMFTADGKVVPTVRDVSQSEERMIKAVEGQMLTLDRPLAYDHVAPDEFRGEVANLSRNVVIESADADTDGGARRGHTMVHPHSHAEFASAEFRQLGKPGVLGRYAVHFHSAGDSLRGSSVVGCSIWDSANRFITVHGTNYLVIRDNVGYRCLGHGFFLEDGTEVYNVFDRNLAVQALRTAPLPGQILPFDKNDGAGFWWANSLNTFTNNIAAECDQYGYRFEMDKPPVFDAHMDVRQPDGSDKNVDVRTLPFVRFEGNEAHSMRRYAFNLGGFRLVAGDDGYTQAADGTKKFDPGSTLIGDVGDVGPDLKHPFHIQDYRAWRSFWAFHSAAPSVYIDGLTASDCSYGIWRSRADHAQYKNLSFRHTEVADIYNPWGGAADFTQDYNKSVKLVDDLPPQTVITGIRRTNFGALRVTGTSTDDRTVLKVAVNGVNASSAAANFSEWFADIPPADTVTATATDQAGNVEQTPHTVKP